MKGSSRPLSLVAPLALACFGILPAADYHVAPAGSGDGRSPAHAAAASAASDLFNDTLEPGDRLLFAPGDYRGMTLGLVNGGSPENPKSIVAAAGAVFRSDWSIDAPAKGATFITLAPGLSHVTFRGLVIQHHAIGISASPAGDRPRTALLFDNVDMAQVRHGFYLSDCHEVVLRDCDLKRYAKHGFRFEQGCARVRLSRCTADCSEGDPVWETKTEVFPFGFIVNEKGSPNTGFVFEDCLAANNIKSNQTVRYTNGDGFVTEGSSCEVTFLRCRALRNQDGGFDLKTADVTLVDCVAIGHRRDFRVWGKATLKNCFAGGSETGLWSKHGSVTLERCTFIAHRKSCLETDGPAPPALRLSDCILVTGQTSEGVAIGAYEGNGSRIAETPAQAGITADASSWDGLGAAMDSAVHTEKGYRSKRRGVPGDQ